MRKTLVTILCSACAFVFAQAAEVELKGVVEELPASGMTGEWKVAGKTIIVSETTVIEADDGKVKVGVLVEVDGTLDDNGRVLAKKIETEK